MGLIDALGRDAGVFCLQDVFRHLVLVPNHPHIRTRRLQCMLEHLGVVHMPAREHACVIVFGQLHVPDAVEIYLHELRAGETLLVQKLEVVVVDHRLESHVRGVFGQVHGHVARAENGDLRRGEQRLRQPHDARKLLAMHGRPGRHVVHLKLVAARVGARGQQFLIHVGEKHAGFSVGAALVKHHHPLALARTLRRGLLVGDELEAKPGLRPLSRCGGSRLQRGHVARTKRGENCPHASLAHERVYLYRLCYTGKIRRLALHAAPISQRLHHVSHRFFNAHDPHPFHSPDSLPYIPRPTRYAPAIKPSATIPLMSTSIPARA